MMPLTCKEKKSCKKQKVYYICKKGFSNDDANKKYHKVRGYCYYTGKNRGATHNICNLRYKTPNEILVVFHDGSTYATYGYNFIIKEVAK